MCDQGLNNKSVLPSLVVSVTQPYFDVDDAHVYYMFDPPHLIKNIRNNFKKSGFIIDGKFIEWKYVEKFYDFDSCCRLCLAPKLTRDHIDVPPFSTMRVRLATQLLSQTVAAGLHTYCQLGKIHSKGVHTAEFVEQMDLLFDCFNSSHLSSPKKFRCAVIVNSGHIEFLKSCHEWLSEIPNC